MYIVTFFSIVAVFFAYLSQFNKYKKLDLFKLGFVLVTIIASIRYNYGTDYTQYFDEYLHNYHSSTFWQSIKDGDFNEPLWAIINHLFPRPYGFFALVALISVFQNYTFYKFIKKNVTPSQRCFAVFIYLFTTSYYILNMSMLRQGLAVAMGVWAGQFIGDKKWLRAAIIILLASFIHNSALVLLPFVILSFLPLRRGWAYGLLLLFLTIVLFLMKDVVSNMFTLSMEIENMEKYQWYVDNLEEEEASLGLGFVLRLVTYLVILYFLVKRIDEFTYPQKVFLILSGIAIMVIPFQLFVTGLAGRMMLYFSVFHISIVPLIYSRIKKKLIRIPVMVIYIFMLLFTYYTFFDPNSWSDLYTNYHTIFEVLL